MRLYNNLVQRCFNDCVDDFRSKHLTDGEEKVRGRRQSGALACSTWSSAANAASALTLPLLTHRTLASRCDRHPIQTVHHQVL